MSQRHSGQPRLSRADHVPSGRDQVHQVTQRWLGNDTVRVVCQQGLAGSSQLARDRPVIAFLRWVFRKLDVGIASHQIAQQSGGEPSQVCCWRGIQLHCRIEIKQPGHCIGADRGGSLRVRQFGERVAGHGEGCQAVQAVGWLPGLRLEARNLKLDWKPLPS